MTVQCPRCGTQYRVPDARLSDPRPVFKCTRCNHVFSSGERTGGRGARASGDDRNLKLPFGGRRGGAKAVPAGSAESDPAPPPAPEPAKRLADPIDDDEDETDLATTASDGKRDAGTQGDAPDGSEPAFVAGGGLDEPDEPDALESEEAGPTGASTGGEAGEFAPRRQRIRRARRAVDLEEDPVVDEDEGPVLVRESDARATVDPVRRAATPAHRHRSPMRPVLTGVAAVLAGFLGLSAMLRQHPDVALERLASVPLLGRLIGDDRLMLVRLDVSGLESSIERIKGERPALVVSGRVTNTTGQNLRLIEVEGRLMAEGVERRRQVVYAANQMRKTIRDLSASEVEMLLRLEPNRRFVVRPGESTTFLLVFPDPPSNATEVDCRIVDARPA